MGAGNSYLCKLYVTIKMGMVYNYIFLFLFVIGLIGAIYDISRSNTLSKQTNVKRLYIENRILFIAICFYVILKCLSAIIGFEI